MTDGPPTVPIRTVDPHGTSPAGSAPRHSSQQRPLTAAIAIGSAGVVLIIAGTFLPWVSSGGHGRNIYELTGLADKLGLFDASPWRAVPILVPLLGPACVAPIVLAILRLRRTAGAAAAAVGTLAVLLASATMLAGRRAEAIGVRLAPLGLWVLLIGGILLAGAGVLALITPTRSPSGAP